MNSTTLWIAQSLVSAFLGVLFLQSGLDKVLDWKGNREYITGYFAKTPLKALTGPMFVSITILGLFFGQRLAKDYAAAAGMVPYALYSLLAILVLGYRGF